MPDQKMRIRKDKMRIVVLPGKHIAHVGAGTIFTKEARNEMNSLRSLRKGGKNPLYTLYTLCAISRVPPLEVSNEVTPVRLGLASTDNV